MYLMTVTPYFDEYIRRLEENQKIQNIFPDGSLWKGSGLPFGVDSIFKIDRIVGQIIYYRYQHRVLGMFDTSWAKTIAQMKDYLSQGIIQRIGS